MSTLRLLVVDDEPLVRSGIRQGLASIAEVTVIGECTSGLEAIAAIRSQRPDLVLLDVQMADCSGLDVVREIGPDRMPAVIFVTAYDEYAVAAFEVNAVDYLLKPFDEDRLRHSIERARERLRARAHTLAADRLAALMDAPRPDSPDRLTVRNGERFEFVPVDSIDWVESANNYVQLHCGAKTHLLGETLTSLERRLAPRGFLRVHRGRLVNVARITSVHAMLSGTYQLHLQTGVRLMTGRQYKRVIQQLISR